MIRIAPRPEYPDFDRHVRQPGQGFLRTTPNPTSAQFKKKNYWGRALKELHAAYSGICAYTAMYLPDRGSVDHFLPKTTYPSLAYEWDNYRLSNARVNSSKGNSTEILDPFEIEDGWFVLDFPSCLIKADPALTKSLRQKINTTINTLGLNNDDRYVEERCNIVVAFAKDQIAYEFLAERYPFLAKEIVRQGVIDQLRDIFRL